MAKFLVEIEFGIDEARRAEIKPTHRTYMRELHAQGLLLQAGAYADQSGALLIFEAPDSETVRKALDADVYYTEGVCRETSLREWDQTLP